LRYQQQLDLVADDLAAYQRVQDDVMLYGGEMQHSYFINDSWTLSSFVDYSRVKLIDASDLPRIPPLRIASQLSAELDDWHANVMVSHYRPQHKTAANESATEGYSLVDASVYKHIQRNDSELVYFVKASNLFDQEARVHSSFLKNKAPLPGVSIKAGVRWSF
jgi:iron complex outermembrane recepter protein